MDPAIPAYVDAAWNREIVPALHDYIRIPNVSPAYEPEWEALGHMERATTLIAEWCRVRSIPGLTVDVRSPPGRTPVIVMEVPASPGVPADDIVLLYGHLDKQPEMTGWRDGLGPWEPILDGDRLYGRGGADDGYSAFASLVAIEAAEQAGVPHARCVVLIEGSEESGSVDLPAHLEALGDRIGSPSLVLCLDSGCPDYEHLWVTTSLRGLLSGRLDVAISSEGVHSGDASGVIPSTFRIARRLLSRIEDEDTGEILLEGFHVDVPPDRLAEIRAAAAILPEPVAARLPFLPGARPVTDDRVGQILNRTWRPTLSVTGADGLPPTGRAGNVLRPSTSLQLSVRLPPTLDPDPAAVLLEKTLTAAPPYGAHVEFHSEQQGAGWNAPPFAPWLWGSLDAASRATFGRPAQAFGEGGSIPFMAMLGSRFPDAQFGITGVLGPGSNAHGPNEFLHLPTGRRLTSVLAAVLGAHASRER